MKVFGRDPKTTKILKRKTMLTKKLSILEKRTIVRSKKNLSVGYRLKAKRSKKENYEAKVNAESVEIKDVMIKHVVHVIFIRKMYC